MKVLSLGHICFLLEMASGERRDPVRILGDPWLSDYAIGDLMGRFPRLRFSIADLAPLDGVFLSHSHTDHFDPYTLVRLWRETSPPRPTLMLPQSLLYLERLLRDHLDGVDVIFLEEGRPVEFRGLTVSGFFNPETRPTNEDDVMVLEVASNREVFVSESDAVLPLYDAETRAMLVSRLEKPGVETICFLTARNQLEATMSMLSARDLDDRRHRTDRSLERAYEDVFEVYASPDEPEDDLWQSDRLVRLVGGQGMCYPQKLGTDWNRVLFPLCLEDRVRMEKEVALSLGCRHQVEVFTPGHVHHLAAGRLAELEPWPRLELLDREDDRRFDAERELFDDFAVAPLVDDPRDLDGQRGRILAVLNDRFLPHLIGSRAPPLEHLLAGSGGEYRIRVRYGTVGEHHDRDYHITFKTLRFHAAPLVERAPDEHYWGNDLDDFLDGRCDEFSLFCRKPLEAHAQRLWNCLGLPYLNNDLVERKLRLHFERAQRGESLEEWVLGFYRA